MHRDGKRIHIHLTSILPLVRHAICLGGILEGLLKGFVLTLGVTKVNRLQLLLLGVQEGRKPYKQEEMSGSFIILTTFFPGLLTWRTSEKATSDREIPPATCSWLGHLQLASCHQPAAALHMVFFFFFGGCCYLWGFCPECRSRVSAWQVQLLVVEGVLWGNVCLGLFWYIFNPRAYFFAFLVSAVHKETKQFFTLYNTLDDKKVYLEKEVRTFIKKYLIRLAAASAVDPWGSNELSV